MARGPDALVKPELLIWARTSAQMSQQMAADKAGVSEERLALWETGAARPTVRQAKTLARVYEQCFSAFFLPKAPPVFKPPAHDYRKLPDSEAAEVAPVIALEMRRALDRRDVVIELAAEANQRVKRFPLREPPDAPAPQVAKAIREALGVRIAEQKRWRQPDVALRRWRESAEDLGVLVFQTKRIPKQHMRGFSISKPILPIIVLNREDSYAGRCFTLMHELAHLTLRTSGVCDLVENVRRKDADQKVEVFCNEVAGRVLVPDNVLKRHQLVNGRTSRQWDDDDIASIARDFAVSRIVIVRRLLRLGLVNKAFYELKDKLFQEQYEANEARRRKRMKEKGGFEPPSTQAVSLAGKPYVRSVLGAFYEDQIDAAEASQLLEVRTQHFGKLSEAVEVT